MNVPRSIFVIALLAPHALHARAEEDAVPTPQPSSRYVAMAEKSPFALATAPSAPETPQASFAANWYVGGIGRLGDTDFVTIKSRDATTQFSLFGRETHLGTGVSLASVEWSETVGKSTVVLRKGTEMAKLEFNEAEVRGPATTASTTAGKTPGKGAATGAGNGSSGTLPLGMSSQPTSSVTVTPSQAGTQIPPSTTAPGEIKRRVRIIPAPAQ